MEDQQVQAAPGKPSVEREGWMTKATPKTMPEALQEDADKAKEEASKKVCTSINLHSAQE